MLLVPSNEGKQPETDRLSASPRPASSTSALRGVWLSEPSGGVLGVMNGVLQSRESRAHAEVKGGPIPRGSLNSA